MSTWKAEVFVNSKVGRITTTVDAATYSGAEEQIYAKHGDVQSITNLRKVGSNGSNGGSFDSSDIGGTFGWIVILGALWALATLTPWILMGLGGAAGTWLGEKISGTSVNEINDSSESEKKRATVIILILMLVGGGFGFVQGHNLQQDWNSNRTIEEVRSK